MRIWVLVESYGECFIVVLFCFSRRLSQLGTGCNVWNAYVDYGSSVLILFKAFAIIQHSPACVPPGGLSEAWVVVYFLLQSSSLLIYCLWSDPLLSSGVNPRAHIKCLGPFLSPLSSLDGLAPRVPPSLSAASLLTLHTCPESPSASRSKWQEDGRENEDFPPWSLNHRVSLVREKHFLPFKYLPLVATWLQLQDWGLLEIKLRGKEKRPWISL